MNRAEKIARIQSVLDELYPDAPIPLRHRDPFTLLVAVLLSAQTTDARVNLVTPALFARADTPAKMAELSVAEIHELIRTCGLAPAKAKALAGLSRILVEKHGGRVPRTFEELEELPGVGHKTASVVMAQAFGIPAFPVDTHIHRLAQRWGLSDGSSVERTERDLKTVFPRDRWIRLHLQIILFGREHCPALRHEPAKCPICSFASARVPGRGAAELGRRVVEPRRSTAATGRRAAEPGGRAVGPGRRSAESERRAPKAGRHAAESGRPTAERGRRATAREDGGPASTGGTSGNDAASRLAGAAPDRHAVKPDKPPPSRARRASSRTRASE